MIRTVLALLALLQIVFWSNNLSGPIDLNTIIFTLGLGLLFD